MEVVRGVESHWKDLSDELGVRPSEDQKIKHLYQSDHQRLEALIEHYTRCHPSRSWKDVSSALERMNLPQLVEVVTTKYVRGMWQLGMATGKWWVSSDVYLPEEVGHGLCACDYVLALHMIAFLPQQPRV